MLVDCFTYFNETPDLLNIRFNELAPYVNYHVVMEANKSHSGQPKPVNFNVDDYPEFKHKIVHLVVEMPDSQDRWELENYQRNALTGFIRHQQGPFWVMISDADEIPSILSWDGKEGVFGGPAFFYKLNRLHPAQWNGTVILQSWRFSSPYGKICAQDARNFRDILPIVGFGWHFSWLGNPYEKVRNFAHSELDKPDFNPDYTKHPGDGRKLITINVVPGYFPQYLVDNVDKYSHLLEEVDDESI